MNEKKPNAKALLPILVFLIIYLGNGIYFEYIKPIKGQMGFYIMSVVVAFVIALVVALIQNRHLSFEDKIHICAKGIGDYNITIMLFIFLVAGAFSGIASAAGGAESTANMLLNIIPPQFAVPGLFIIACLISMAMGTSVGTISVIVPIAVNVSIAANLNMSMCVATVVGGAMFGDNLSFVSDTTIAATNTQGVEMKDKFRTNIKVALPAAVLTLIILVITSIGGEAVPLQHYEFNVWQAIPYFVVLIAAIAGINVFTVLCSGTVLFFIVGLFTGSLSIHKGFMAMGAGTSGMFETMIVTILVASIGALMRENGGFSAILKFIRKYFHGERGGKFGIGILTMLMDVATANNTVAIVLAAPIATEIREDYNIDPKETASLLDTFSCIAQGIIPYGAQLLIAAGLTDGALSSLNIIPYLYYQFLLLICVSVSIIIKKTPEKN